MSLVEFKVENKIGWLTINRPEALNALNKQVLSSLHEILQQAKSLFPKELRALVITGAGEKAFVAGADIKEMHGLTSAQAEEFAKFGQSVFRELESFPAPVVAAVNGFALGGGLELALACDYIYASENAKVGLPEVSLGLIPGFGGTVRLSRAVGLARAREMIFSGSMLTSAQAKEMGLILEVVPVGDLRAFVENKLTQVINKAPLAVQRAKVSVLASHDVGIDAGMGIEKSQFGELFQTKDVSIGLAAFVEKKKAEFLGE